MLKLVFEKLVEATYSYNVNVSKPVKPVYVKVKKKRGRKSVKKNTF